MGSIVVRAGSASTEVKINRPRFSRLWEAFTEVGSLDAEAVYELVGGEALALRKQKPKEYANACAIRISRAFNYGGYKVPSGTVIKTKSIYRVRGSDGMPYIVRVRQMIEFLEYNWGKPDLLIAPGGDSALAGKTGIIAVNASGWENASGHVVLWNGKSTSDGSDYQRLDSYAWRDSSASLTETLYWELKG